MEEKALILDELGINRALSRLSHEIIERNKGVDNVVFIGIKTRGVPLAEILSNNIKKFEGKKTKVGILDITLYRDDLEIIDGDPTLNDTNIPFDIEGKDIILTDDVLYTGRTVRSAIDAIMEIARPNSIQLAVLIDRGHRELPIRADYVGKNLPTAKHEKVKVFLSSTDGENKVILYEKKSKKF